MLEDGLEEGVGRINLIRVGGSRWPETVPRIRGVAREGEATAALDTPMDQHRRAFFIFFSPFSALCGVDFTFRVKYERDGREAKPLHGTLFLYSSSTHCLVLEIGPVLCFFF